MSGQSITEKWEYKTDIITSYDGHEQRFKLRQKPRHFLSYDYPAMNSMQAQWLRGLGRMRQSDTYYIPMWHSPVHLRESHIAGSALYINYEDMFALNNSEYIEIFVRDDVNQTGINMVRQVYEYLDGIIGVTKGINKPLNKLNTWIYPLKRCSVQPMSGLQYIWSNGSNVTHNFEDLLLIPTTVHIPDKYISEYEEYEQWNRWSLPEEAWGKQILIIPPQWIEDNSVSLNVDKNTFRLDNETGIFQYDLKNTKSYDIHTWELTLMNRKSINNMIRFFNRVSGMYKSFYCPTWVNDVNIIQDIQESQNYVYVDWNKISDFYISNSRSKKLVIFTKDWKCYGLEVWTYGHEKLPTGEKVGKLILKNTAGFNLSVDNILMTSYLNLVRLDSDELQLNYETETVANVTLIMREVDDI